MKTCVIGDIHGCLSSLHALLDRVGDKVDTFVFLGDYVDRGPAAKEVIDLLLALKATGLRLIPLRGNHEAMLLDALSGSNRELFLLAGGLQTVTSYDGDPEHLEHLSAVIPSRHLAFLQSLPLFHEDENGIYVHAGLQPGRHLSQQTADWCLWARDLFIHSPYDFGKPVIFGHTVFQNPFIDNNKIGIDTGAVYGGRLTALLLPDMQFISVPGEKKQPAPLPDGMVLHP